MWYLLVFPTVLALFLVFVSLASRRFEARERESGRWDEYGPLEETEPPPSQGQYGLKREMSERLEASGQWIGKVLRRRQPGEKP